MKRTRTDHSQAVYERYSLSQATGWVVTENGVVGTADFAQGDSATYLFFVAGGREYRRIIEPGVSDRRIVTEAKRFAADYA